MFKKILFGIFSLLLGIIVYYISWISTSADYIMSKARKAAKENNQEFFLKWFDRYANDSVYSYTYTNGETHSTLNVYEVYDSNEKTIYTFLFTDFSDNVNLDSDADSKDSSISFYFGSQEKIIYKSLFAYDNICLVQIDYKIEDIIADLSIYDNKGTDDKSDDVITTEASFISKIILKDAKDKVIFESESSSLFSVVDYDDEHWVVDDENIFKGHTNAELKSKFYYHYPQMWKVWRNLGIYILVDAGFALFLFWPRKNKFDKMQTNDSLNNGL